MSEYKSIEKRIEEGIIGPTAELASNFCKEAGEFAYTFSKGAYATLVSQLRIPTLIRKKLNKQTIADRQNPTYIIEYMQIGGILAASCEITAALVIATGLVDFDSYNIGKFALGTNLLSGIYELGRMKTSKKEYAESRVKQ
jgi:hypothetical protein